MSLICVEIELDPATGAYSVGKCEPKEESAGGEVQADTAGEQQFQNVDEALQAAKDLLAESGGQSQNDAWNQVQRDRAMANQPGGPMMGKP